jgi:raffinose/stachyose/melibiose transport system substrate-binding protein
MNRRWRSRLGLGLFLAGYAWAVMWVFTRSTPIRAERPITIRVAHWQIERGPPDGLAAIIRRYEELHPRVKVEQVLVPGGGPIYRQWLRSNLIGGTGVDLLEFGIWLDGMSDIPARYFAPITKEMLEPNPYNRGTPLEHVPWWQTFRDGLISQQVNAPVPGQFYAATLTEVSTRLFCNKALMREITGGVKMPATLADLRAMAEKVRAFAARTDRPIYTMAGSRDNAEWLAEFLMQGAMMRVSQRNDRNGNLGLNNWDVLGQYLEGRWSFRSPEARAGLALVREVGVNMKPGFLQSQRDAATLEFLQGNALFIFAGSWDGTSLRSLATFPVEIIRYPQPTPDDPVIGKYYFGPFADGGGGTGVELYLNKQSAHSAEAVDFLRFLSSMEGSQLFTDHSGWLPAVIGVKVAGAIQAFETPRDCFSFGATYITMGSTVLSKVALNMYQLSGPQGSVDKFVEAMEAGMPEAVRTDLQKEASNRNLSVRPQDVQIMALQQLARRRPEDAELPVAQERLESSQTMTEAQQLQIKVVLAKAGPAP